MPLHFDNPRSDDDLLGRMDRLESRLNLRDLVSRYCKACDDRDLSAMGELFAEDGIITTGDGSVRHEGREAVIAMFAESQRSMRMTNHWVHDQLVSFMNADQATGIAYAHVEANMDGTAMIGALRYHDDYARSGGQWRFLKRHIELIYFCPATDIPGVLAGMSAPAPDAGQQ